MAKTDPITPPQVNFIELLASERDISTLTLEQQAWLRTPDALRTISRGKASEIIQLLKQLPKLATEQPTVNKPTEPLPVGFDIDKGRYFVVDPTDGVEKFIKVDKPEPPSRWAGRTFFSVQASDDFYPLKDRAHIKAITEEIAKDPIEAMNQYGIRLGVCGRCGRTLTRLDSRLRGMGPVCADIVLGTASEEDVQTLEQLGLI